MKDNFCVILAGGVGSRFWPYSSTSEPKQFLDFLGTGRSLLQMTYDRVCKVVDKENVYISTNKKYKDLVLEQLPSVSEHNILLEPAVRNTAPCIAYAMYKIKAINENAKVWVTPSDQLILKESEYVDTLNRGFRFISENDCLLTVGIKPNRPETAYGYIQIGETEVEQNLFKVKTFTEKPNADLAQIFLESGEFYWNSSMFLWSVKSISEAFELYMSELARKFSDGKDYYNTPEEQPFIDKIYQSCTNNSIDYQILEKAQNVYVITADFGWSDLGTWSSVYSLADAQKDKNNNLMMNGKTLLYESKNNIIALPKDKLAVVQGVEDLVITESNNVLLICRRNEENRIRQFVNDTRVQVGKEYL
ncbi:MAG: mannose-1-phosphate guanylyltransferase [Paludibacteraceae bacterium]|nr:mannose-1-phosphate guanylyltransferase [Paludibacteraceae bacterium]